jgi:hypothetical protein
LNGDLRVLKDGFPSGKLWWPTPSARRKWVSYGIHGISF